MIQRLIFRDIFGARADNNAKLHFVIGLHRSARNDNIIIRPLQRIERFQEHDRLLRDRRAGFRRVIGVVQPDANQILHARDGRAKARIAGDLGQAIHIHRGNLRQRGGGEHITGDVRHNARKITNGARSIQNAGFFLAERAVAKQFHGGFLPLSKSIGTAGTHMPEKREACGSECQRMHHIIR